MMPLVLIPGMMCDERMWGEIPQALAPLPIMHALPTGADTLAGIAARILREAPARFALAGLSLGGIVAMELLSQAPDRIDRLALLDTNPRAELPKVRANRQLQIDRALAGDLDIVMRDEMKPNYLSDPGNRRVLDLCMDMALALGPLAFRDQSLALRDRPDQSATLAAFTGPALVVMGADDRLCPLDRHQQMHRLMPQSRLVIIDGAGHLPPLERPDPTLHALKDWLAA